MTANTTRPDVFQERHRRRPGKYLELLRIATIYGDLGKADQALPYLKQAIDLGGEDVRQAARTQSHFDKIRNNKQFQQIVG